MKYRQIDLQHDVVTRRQRPMDKAEEYYRALPELEVANLVRHSRYTPKLLFQGREVYTEEFINGNSLDSLYGDFQPIDHADIDAIIQNIVYLTHIKNAKMQAKQPWQNGEDFFEFQIETMRAAIDKYPKRMPLWLQTFGLTDAVIKVADNLPPQIHSDRPLCLIHGDRSKTNMIKSGQKVYFIDWEYGCFGDLAYEIAFHLYQMNYCDEDKEYFLQKLERQLPRKYKSALEDVPYYRRFVALRSAIYTLRAIYECSISRSNCEKVRLRFYKLAKYPEFWIHKMPLDEIREKVQQLKAT